jgi:hypothetical protein
MYPFFKFITVITSFPKRENKFHDSFILIFVVVLKNQIFINNKIKIIIHEYNSEWSDLTKIIKSDMWFSSVTHIATHFTRLLFVVWYHALLFFIRYLCHDKWCDFRYDSFLFYHFILFTYQTCYCETLNQDCAST